MHIDRANLHKTVIEPKLSKAFGAFKSMAIPSAATDTWEKSAGSCTGPRITDQTIDRAWTASG